MFASSLMAFIALFPPSPHIHRIGCSSFKGGISVWSIITEHSGSNNNPLSLSIRAKY